MRAAPGRASPRPVFDGRRQARRPAEAAPRTIGAASRFDARVAPAGNDEDHAEAPRDRLPPGTVGPRGRPRRRRRHVRRRRARPLRPAAGVAKLVLVNGPTSRRSARERTRGSPTVITSPSGRRSPAGERVATSGAAPGVIEREMTATLEEFDAACARRFRPPSKAGRRASASPPRYCDDGGRGTAAAAANLIARLALPVLVVTIRFPTAGADERAATLAA